MSICMQSAYIVNFNSSHSWNRRGRGVARRYDSHVADDFAFSVSFVNLFFFCFLMMWKRAAICFAKNIYCFIIIIITIIMDLSLLFFDCLLFAK